MSIRSSIVVLVMSGLVIPNAYARSSVPIVNHENIAIATGSGRTLTAEEVKAAIIEAGARTRYPWTVSGSEAGILVATTLVRGKHTAVVTIRYSDNNYSVIYRDSSDLNYKVSKGVPKIHPNYNVWVKQLIDAIHAQLMQL